MCVRVCVCVCVFLACFYSPISLYNYCLVCMQRYFEDMLKTKNLEAVKAAHEIEALVNNLEATKAEAQEEREAMQNVILELNEKL